MLVLGSMRQEVGIHFHKECTGAIKWLALVPEFPVAKSWTYRGLGTELFYRVLTWYGIIRSSEGMCYVHRC